VPDPPRSHPYTAAAELSRFALVREDLDPESLQEHIAHLLVALEHRTVIGQATGVVMERYGLKSNDAFRVLVRISSERRRKVYDIACELVTEGPVDGLERPPAT
jgi:AmiR/NasT family two-component response regulator